MCLCVCVCVCVCEYINFRNEKKKFKYFCFNNLNFEPSHMVEITIRNT
jgi:hypothetical protein